MIQFFRKARPNEYFKTRSAARNAEIDHARVTTIFRAIEDGLEGARAEQAGLKSRVDDAIARSAVTLGNDSDEFLTRDPEDNHYQNLLGTEIADGQRRLKELEVTISHIRFLKTALVTRFPDFDFGHNTPARS
jgi:hypothetical protein